MTSLAFLSSSPNSRPRRHFAGWRPLAAVLALALLAGCAAIKSPTQARGHKVDEDLLKELVPGTSSRADVTALLGSPTAHATFDDGIWIYVASVTRTQIGRMPGIDNQDVTVITFNDAGIVQNIRRLNQDDSVPVDVVGRATPTPGSETTFLQEFLGNVGRLNPGGLGKSGAGGSGPGTGPGH